MTLLFVIVGGIVGIIVAFFLGRSYATKFHISRRIRETEQEMKSILEDSKKDAESLKKEKLLEVKEEWYKRKTEFEDQTRDTKNRLKTLEDQLLSKERNIELKGDLITRKDKELTSRESVLDQKMTEVEKTKQILEEKINSENEKLEKVAQLTTEEAKQILMDNMKEKAKEEAAEEMRRIKERAQAEAKDEIKSILLQAIERSSINHAVDTTVTTIKLPNDEMKGRIIGREGRNIRAFETITGCELLIDDTPEIVVISGFDPIRREIAKLTLDYLVQDGRIHPGRIEDVVEKARTDLDEIMLTTGEQALYDVDVHGVDPELVKLLGKLKYRLAKGQNVLQHSMETASIAGLIAAELGFDVQSCKRAGILHDIGYALDKSDQHHSIAGSELVKKYGESEVVQQAIQFHHENPNINNPVAVILHTANLLSKERKGAQRESLEKYIKRLSKLEDMAHEFPGINAAYAIQAGREIRVMIDCSVIDDERSIQLADDLAKKVENEYQYPGQVKITVIREYRAEDLAK